MSILDNESKLIDQITRSINETYRNDIYKFLYTYSAFGPNIPGKYIVKIMNFSRVLYYNERIYNTCSYSYKCDIRVANLDVMWDKKEECYYIIPRDSRYPIYLNNIGLTELPPYIKFKSKNGGKLTFLIKSYNTYEKWFKNLPKGSKLIIMRYNVSDVSHEHNRIIVSPNNFLSTQSFKDWLKENGEVCYI